MGREYPVDEREWIQPARVRLGVVARRLWPSFLIALVIWLGWLAAVSRRRRRP
ncbi:MAG: hypothetical protein ACRD0A_11165 [Acidimicrobiales bacterium]